MRFIRKIKQSCFTERYRTDATIQLFEDEVVNDRGLWQYHTSPKLSEMNVKTVMKYKLQTNFKKKKKNLT